MNGFPLLSLIVFMPVIGALVLLFVPGTNHRAIRWIALATVLVTFALSLGLLGYNPNGSGMLSHDPEAPWHLEVTTRYRLPAAEPRLSIEYTFTNTGEKTALVPLGFLLDTRASIETGGYWHHQAQREQHPSARDERFQDALLDELARHAGIAITS